MYRSEANYVVFKCSIPENFTKLNFLFCEILLDINFLVQQTGHCDNGGDKLSRHYSV